MLTQNHFNLSRPIFLKSGNDTNTNIITITMTMQESQLEYSKCIGEMTITIPATGNPEITVNNLTDYNNALVGLLKNYDSDHTCEGK